MRKKPSTHYGVLCLLLILPLLLSACAEVPTSPADKAQFDATNDPMEPLNRTVFGFNRLLDAALVRPIAETYRWVFPVFVRNRISDVVSNMKEPVVLVNNLLQGDFDKAGITFERFILNTTTGVAGMWDVANDWGGLPPQIGDFGQTLYVWGFHEGPYTMLPLLGPSNLRDKIGLFVDFALSPWQYIAWIGGPADFYSYEIASFSGNVIVKREKNIETVDALCKESLDCYSEIRSTYRQFRAKQIGSETPPDEADFDDDENK